MHVRHSPRTSRAGANLAAPSAPITTRNKLSGELWEQDKMVIIYSATKGSATMTLTIAHSWRCGSIMKSESSSTGPSSRSRAKNESRSSNFWHARRALRVPRGRRSGASSSSWIACPSCSLVRNRRGSLGISGIHAQPDTGHGIPMSQAIWIADAKLARLRHISPVNWGRK